MLVNQRKNCNGFNFALRVLLKTKKGLLNINSTGLFYEQNSLRLRSHYFMKPQDMPGLAMYHFTFNGLSEGSGVEA